MLSARVGTAPLSSVTLPSNKTSSKLRILSKRHRGGSDAEKPREVFDTKRIAGFGDWFNGVHWSSLTAGRTGQSRDYGCAREHRQWYSHDYHSWCFCRTNQRAMYLRPSSNSNIPPANGRRTHQKFPGSGAVCSSALPRGVYTKNTSKTNSSATPQTIRRLFNRGMEKTDRMSLRHKKTLMLCITIIAAKLAVVACRLKTFPGGSTCP